MIPRISIMYPTAMATSPFYNDRRFVGGGKYKNNSNFQCVSYAIGRQCELSNKPVTWYRGYTTPEEVGNVMFNRSGYGDACNWIRDTLWEHGTKPRLGAVMVYGTKWGGGLGHVRVVEKIEGDRIFYSAANESQQMAFKWINKPAISANGFLGYIYNPYIEEDKMLLTFKKDDAYEWVWSVDGNKYGTDYSITTANGFRDEKLEAEGYELMLKVNGSLFYQYDGLYYAEGLEKSRGVNNQDVSMSAVYDFNNAMAIAGYKEDLYFASQKWVIDNMLDKSYCAITGLGLLVNGKKRNDLHKGFEAQWSQISGRTVIGEDSKGNILSFTVQGETNKQGYTCPQLQDKCLELGFYNAICLDGGGSVFRQYRNDQGQLVYDATTSRKVKNALMLYRRKKDQGADLEAQISELQAENEKLREQLTQTENELDKALGTLQKIKELL